MVPDKKGLSIWPRECKVIGRVPRRGDRLQRPVSAFDGVALTQLDIGLELAVRAGFRRYLFTFVARPRCAVWTLGIDLGPGRSLDARGVGRVIPVSVGDQNMRHRFAPHCIKQRRGVFLVVWAWIDDRDLAPANDITDCPRQGEWAGVIAENPPHTRPNFLRDTRLERKVAIEGHVLVVGHRILAIASRTKRPIGAPSRSRPNVGCSHNRRTRAM